VRLLPGRDASLVNLSRGGALIELESRVLPGTRVEIMLSVPDWRWTGRARVLRCHVSALVREDGVRYRAALQFDAPMPRDGRVISASAGPAAQDRGYQVPDELGLQLPERAVTTRVSKLESGNPEEMPANNPDSTS
jgi:hypothetical protein